MRGGNTWIDSVTHMTQGITAGVTLGPPNQLCNGPVTAASLIPSDISTVIVSLEHTLASAGYCNPRYHPLECLPYKCVAVIVLCPAQFQCDTNTHTHTHTHTGQASVSQTVHPQHLLNPDRCTGCAGQCTASPVTPHISILYPDSDGAAATRSAQLSICCKSNIIPMILYLLCITAATHNAYWPDTDG